MSGYKLNNKLDAFIRSRGGQIRYSHGSKLVTFEDPAIQAVVDGALRKVHAKEDQEMEQFQAALARAEEYGTAVIPVWRPRGEGWFVATSHEQHPGMLYLTQIDIETGIPIQHGTGGFCECDFGMAGGMWCHHNAAAVLWVFQHLPMSLEETLQASLDQVSA